MKQKTHSLNEFGAGTLIKTYDKLGKTGTHDLEKAVQAMQYQSEISQELERRGWTYEEESSEWVYYLR